MARIRVPRINGRIQLGAVPGNDRRLLAAVLIPVERCRILRSFPRTMDPNDQVSGHHMSLLEAINQGIVPKPPLMKWNAYLTWRSKYGLRPIMARDRRSTENGDEFKLFVK